MSSTTGNNPHRGWLAALAVLAIMIGFGASLLIWRSPPAKDETSSLTLTSGTLIAQPRPLTPFNLTNHRGDEFSQDSIKGGWHLLSFGYTHCPDICPTTLALLARLTDRLRNEPGNPDIQIAFVSIDPERDTPQVLARYVPYFDNSFIGVTGNRQELENLTRQLGVLHARVENEQSQMGYLMDHSTSIILTNPQGQFQALFSAPHDAEAMARDLIQITTH